MKDEKTAYFYAKRAWFVMSVLIIGVAYGIASHQWGLFPSSFARRAFLQVENLGWVKSSLYSHEAVYEREGVRKLGGGGMQSGMTAVSSWWEESDDRKFGIKLIDKDGVVVHKWWIERGNLFENGLSQRRGPLESHLTSFLILPNGDVVGTLSYVGLFRLNSCGDVLWTLPEGTHHSVTQADDSTFWVSAVSQQRQKGSDHYPSGYPGLGRVWLDRVIQVSGEGEVINDINILDIIYDNNLERLLFQHKMTSGDVTHLNDVEPLSRKIANSYPLFESGDLLISLRNINTVLVFDPNSGTVKWFKRDPFIRQHDPDYIGSGWIGVFDNNWKRGGEVGGSRIIGFQPHTDSTKFLFRPNEMNRFYTIHKGDWQMLKNKNMLLTESAGGRVIEVSPSGKLIWEWVHESYESGIFNKYDSIVPAVPIARRYEFSKEDVDSWRCSTVEYTSESSPEK